MGSTEKVRICSQSQDHSNCPVCAGRSHGEDLADTQAIHFLWETKNCTSSDPFRLELSLTNKQFSWADQTVSSERWAFLRTSAGRCIFSAQFSFGSTAPQHTYGRCSPTALNSLIFLLYEEVQEHTNADCWWLDSGTPFQSRTKPDYEAILFSLELDINHTLINWAKLLFKELYQFQWNQPHVLQHFHKRTT